MTTEEIIKVLLNLKITISRKKEFWTVNLFHDEYTSKDFIQEFLVNKNTLVGDVINYVKSVNDYSTINHSYNESLSLYDVLLIIEKR